AEMKQDGNDLIRALSAWLYRERKIEIPLNAWKPDNLPVHLKVRFSLLDDSGREMAAGRDPSLLTAVQTTSSDRGRSSRYRKEHELKGLQAWPDMDIPESVIIPGGAVLWPAFMDEGNSVSFRFFDTRNDAGTSHKKAQAAFALIYWNREIRDFQKNLHISGQPRVIANYIGGAAGLEDALWDRVIYDVFSSKLIRDKKTWDALLKDGGGRIHSQADDYLNMISAVLDSYGEQRKILVEMEGRSHRPDFIKEMIKNLEGIVSRDFITRFKPEIWKSLPRWMKAVVSRARKGIADPLKDRKASEIWDPLKARLVLIKENLSPMAGSDKRSALEEAGIMIEELKVALFATGDVRPSGKISESRMRKKLDEIEMLL
ncbi:MAG: DUF3418 domain-containing protein, partial [Spirochaetaceae bacterium]|nr:DUF3418 domain-containing protein [Spirochaetaceae bacterium]